MKKLLSFLVAFLFFAPFSVYGQTGIGGHGPTYGGDPAKPGVVSELKLDHTTEVLNANRTILITDNPVLWFDCNGTTRNVTLPPEAANSTDLVFTIVNVSDGAGEDLIIRNDTPATLKTIGTEQGERVSCDGTTWEVWFDNGIYYDGIGRTLNIPLGGAAGNNFKVDTNKFVVEGDTGRVGVGTAAPLGTFNIQSADSGVTPSGVANSLFIENSSWGGMTIACGTSAGGTIYFGDSGDADSASITYYGTGHATYAKRLSFRTDGVSNRMYINGSGNIGYKTTTFAFTTDGNLTDPLAGSVYLLDGDNDGANETLYLLDGETAGQFVELTAAADIDANDLCTISMARTTCTNCPTIVFNKVGENARLSWIGTTWVLNWLQDAW